MSSCFAQIGVVIDDQDARSQSALRRERTFVHTDLGDRDRIDGHVNSPEDPVDETCDTSELRNSASRHEGATSPKGSPRS
jgi:hypothetical protein